MISRGGSRKIADTDAVPFFSHARHDVSPVGNVTEARKGAGDYEISRNSLHHSLRLFFLLPRPPIYRKYPVARLTRISTFLFSSSLRSIFPKGSNTHIYRQKRKLIIQNEPKKGKKKEPKAMAQTGKGFLGRLRQTKKKR